MLSNPPSNRVALIITISCIKVNLNNKKLKAKLYQIHYKLHPLIYTMAAKSIRTPLL